ncbi:MAG TPA: O-antigen ligase family protein [Williamwhitmania sp.]|nr:O-antigen ligase family protein [Williamwhitmania sp.]
MFPKYIHRFFLVFFSTVLAFSLPVSEFTLSVGIIALVVNWIVEGEFRRKVQAIKQNRSLQWFLVIYFLSVAGLVFTSSFSWAFHDLRIKLPLLVLPLVFSTTNPFTRHEKTIVLLGLIGGVLAGSFISMLVVFQVIPKVIHSSRDISLFISHIRFSLLVNMALCSSVYLLRSYMSQLSRLAKIGGVMLILWLFAFIFILQSLTGVVVLALLTAWFVVWQVRSISDTVYRFGAITLSAAVLFIMASYITSTIAFYYTVEKLPDNLQSYRTANGRSYTNNLESTAVENGHYVDVLICEPELKNEWSRRSNVGYDSIISTGYPVNLVLKRFLTSKGLRKDSIGVWSLSKKEINAINNGVANVLEMNPFSIRWKIYRTVWELDSYRKGANVGGYSIAQRFVFWKAASTIFSKHWLTGVGTGDIKEAYADYYRTYKPELKPQFRLRAHNQFLTMFVSDGIWGGLLFIFALLYPFIKNKAWNDLLANAFILIAIVSMLDEDTLEVHIGVSFVAFFYSMLILAINTHLPAVPDDDKIKQ